MSTENSDKMKAISASRIRVALRGAQISFANETMAINDIADIIMAAAVEIQQPETVLRVEHDLVLAKNRTLLALVKLMTEQLNAKPDRPAAKETDRRVGVRIRQVDGSERNL